MSKKIERPAEQQVAFRIPAVSRGVFANFYCAGTSFSITRPSHDTMVINPDYQLTNSGIESTRLEIARTASLPIESVELVKPNTPVRVRHAFPSGTGHPRTVPSLRNTKQSYNSL